MSGAIFFDRDGTLIYDRVYLSDPAGVELIPGARAALLELRALGFIFFLFTNQSGIGRGFHTIEDTHRVHARLEALLNLDPPTFADICIAPEAPEHPQVYRKPSPRFILEKVAEHKLEPAQCWMVGDSQADVGSALAAEINAAAVRTGKIDPATLPLLAEKNIPIFDSVVEFAAFLKSAFLENARTRRG